MSSARSVSITVGADQVADDVAFGGDDVDRLDVDAAAVADHEVGAGAADHAPGVGSGAAFAEVDHDFGAVAAGHLQHPVDLAALAVMSWWAPSWRAGPALPRRGGPPRWLLG